MTYYTAVAILEGIRIPPINLQNIDSVWVLFTTYPHLIRTGDKP
jgi:hypothetical protein